jgi:isopentenyl-diphosphate delta-isomerase
MGAPGPRKSEPTVAEVVLLDSSGRPVGSAAKLVAHQPPGVLHSAFSVFIRDSRGRHLVQRRALGKYHFAGKWANACCGHPAPGASSPEAARLRLEQEMGIVADLSHIGIFTYHAIDPVSGLVEHELDELYTGVHDADPNPDPIEVEDWGWVEPEELARRMASEPETFAPWLMIAFEAFPGLLAPG